MSKKILLCGHGLETCIKSRRFDLAVGTESAIATNETIAYSVQGCGIQALPAQSFLTESDIAKLEDRAALLFDEWGNNCTILRAATEYQGISLWTATENSILRRNGLYDALAFQKAAKHILERNQVEQIRLLGSQSDVFLIAAAQCAHTHDIPLNWTPVTATPRSLRLQLRQRGRVAYRRLRRAFLRPLYLPAKSGTRRVVFLPYTSRHVRTILPILFLLHQRDDWETYVLAASPDAETALREAGERYHSFWAYEIARSSSIAKLLRSRWITLKQHPDLLRCFTDEIGTSLWSLMRPKLAEMFDVQPGCGGVFAERFLEAARYTEITQAMLDRLNPHLLVVMNELNVLGRTAVLVARRAGVPTLHLQHGIMAKWMLWRKSYSDHVAVWGAANREQLVAAGIPAQQVTVTGNPAFDCLTRPVLPEDIHTLRASLGLPDNKPIILVTTQNDSMEASRQQLQAVIHAVGAFQQYQIVVKLHPAEKLKPYQRMLKALHAPQVCLTRDVDLFTLLEASAVLVTRFSTTGLEAMLRKKPVITLNFTGTPDKLPYAASGAALGVYRPENLGPALTTVLEDADARAQMQQNQERFIHDYAFRVDGQASQRVVNLIDEIIQNE